MNREIRQRLEWVLLYEETKNAGLTCRRCGISRTTLKKWLKRLHQHGVKGLESHVIATDGNMNNGCISSPEEGRLLLQHIHKLFHDLKTDFKIKKVHVLPRASNAACVFFGMAIDNYHPKIVIYDFNGPTISPKLLIESDLSGVEIKALT